MKLLGLDLCRVRMPLRSPFRTSFGVETERDVLLVRAETTEAEGWGECVAMSEPLYSAEYVAGAAEVVERFLAPPLLAADRLTAETVGDLLAPVRGHPMAKGAVETALLDAQLRAAGRSLAEHLGGVRSRCAAGVSVGIMDDVDELLAAVAGYVEQGYVRVKLKIQPGWDVEVVREVRAAFGDDLPLQVDANAAYSLADAPHLRRLDAFDLVLIEQPLADGDLRQHAELSRLVQTPICLDESITSAQVAADALALGACRVVNIKPGRVGGYLESRRIHDLCRAHGVPVWCGGMLETGLGRAANLALASLPGFTLPGDISASDRYYETDLTPPFVLADGHVEVPQGPGIGVRPVPELLSAATTWRRWVGR